MDQNQTPQPDYNFIVNQPQDGAAPDGAPKKHSKKLIVLAVLVVVTIIVLIIAVVFSGTEPTNSTQYPKATTAPEASSLFMAALADGNDTDLARASSYVDTSGKPDDLVVPSLQRLKDLIDFSQCTEDDATNQEFATYTCLDKTGKNVIVTIETKQVGDRVLVNTYRISDV